MQKQGGIRKGGGFTARSRLYAALAALILAPVAGHAFGLPDDADLRADTLVGAGTFDLAIGPYRQGSVEKLQVYGEVRHSAWRLPGAASTSMLLAPLRAEILADGYEVIFECEAATCGGFDFRYEAHVLPEPVMHVDLGDFR